jgi:hypothetical protein
MSQEERQTWINEKGIGIKACIDRYNLINFNYGLSLAGIKVGELSVCGELKLDDKL